jgi:hypothetical protein
MKHRKPIKIKIEYINEKLSKKPQIVIGDLVGHSKKNKKTIKIKRKVAHENFIQTFNLANYKQLKDLCII